MYGLEQESFALARKNGGIDPFDRAPETDCRVDFNIKSIVDGQEHGIAVHTAIVESGAQNDLHGTVRRYVH